MLKITKLNVDINEIQLLEDIDLEVNEGEIHAILGPTGSGKSALAHAILGHPSLSVKGKINFKRKLMASISPEDRCKLGVFATFQDPPEIQGITNMQAVQDILTARDEKEELTTFISNYKELVKKFDLGAEWGGKDFNLGASKVEKKKNELLQMFVLDPDLAIIDDIDLGLEKPVVDEIAQTVKQFLSRKGKAGIIITQNATILDTIKPTHVHVLVDGKIVKTGDRRIIKRIIEDGYRKFS